MRRLPPIHGLTLFFLIGLIFLTLLFRGRIPLWHSLIFRYLLWIGLLFVIQLSSNQKRMGKFRDFVYTFSPILFIILICFIGGYSYFKNDILALFSKNRDETFKYLSKFGSYEYIKEEIIRQLNKTHLVFKTIHMTDDWLIFSTLSEWKIVKYSDMVWCYKSITTHYRNGVKTGKTYSLIIYDNAKRKFDMRCSNEEEVGLILYCLSQKTPGILFGYDAGFLNEWKKSPEKFIREHAYENTRYS